MIICTFPFLSARDIYIVENNWSVKSVDRNFNYINDHLLEASKRNALICRIKIKTNGINVFSTKYTLGDFLSVIPNYKI